MAIIPFKVIDLGTNRKVICNFLLVINTKLHSYLAPFQSYGRLLVKFALSTGGTSLHHTHLGWTPKLRTTKFCLKKQCSTVWCKKCFDILNHLRVDHECDRQMDRTSFSNSTVYWPMLIKPQIHKMLIWEPLHCGEGKGIWRGDWSWVRFNVPQNTL